MLNPFANLMARAAAHAAAHGALAPMLSPEDCTVATDVPVAALQAMGVRVIPWTTNDPAKMRALLRAGVDGLISDRPDLLQRVLAEERAAHPDDTRLQRFIVSAHRGGRGLRPENTLPSFECGLDHLATELETDTGVSSDGVSLLWHDQFYSPHSCRRADGAEYTLEQRLYLRDLSLAEAQSTFVCDQLPFGPAQTNDLVLSPVAVAFAVEEHMPNPYVPTYAAQIFRFVSFYAEYYSHGPGRLSPLAAERAANALTVRFNLETKIVPEYVPDGEAANETVGPQAFVTALAGAIVQAGLTARCAIQSFDFRTLQLVEEQFPAIQTIYLTEDPATLATKFVPPQLR